MKEWFEIFKQKLKEQSITICSYLFWIIILAVSTTVFLLCFGNKIYTFYSKHIMIPKVEELSSCELNYVNKLIDKGGLTTVSDFYTGTIAYYDSLISILVALLGLFAVISWMVNRLKIKNEVENIVQEHLDKKDHQRLLKELLKQVLDVNFKSTINETGVKDEIRNEILQLVIADIEKDKQQTKEILKVDGKEK